MDEFLASMGIAPQEPQESSQPLLGDAEPTVTVPEPQQAPHELTASEFNDILDDLGFNPPDAEAEEIIDDPLPEEGRDILDPLLASDSLDELNDAQMEIARVMVEANDNNGAMIVREDDHVVFIYPDGHQIEVPIIHEGETLDERITGHITAAEANDLLAGGTDVVSDTIMPPSEEEIAHMEAQLDLLAAAGVGGVDNNGNVSIPNEPAEVRATVAPLIPENSPTLTASVSTSRFSGAEWYELVRQQRIIIGGAGGIGSWLAFQIARLSPSTIAIYDDDNVELGNLSGQLFSRNDVGRPKVRAIENAISNYNDSYCVHAVPSRFTENTEAGKIMMCGFDNMEARKTFYYSWQNFVGSYPEDMRNECLFLDGRLSMGVLQVFCITGDNTYAMEKYSSSYLFDDSEADETVCSMKQTTYMACMIGSVMTNLFVNFIGNLTEPVLPYDLPFFTEYDAQNMIFKTEN